MFGNPLHISKGVRMISWATAVRFSGWGFVEIFIPVFLLSFANNFLETGLLKSVYDVVFLLSLPVISRLADRLSGKRIILSGLVLYPIISICYFLAGVYGAVAFVIAARFINGLSYSLDMVGKKTYMRRNAHDHLGVVFGYFDTLSSFWWLAAAVAGLFLMKSFPFHQLFLLIIPTTIVAIIFISKIPHEPKEGRGISTNFPKEVYRDYKEMFGFIKKWTIEQKYVTLLYAFMGVMFIIINFFVPLVSFAENQNYLRIFLLTAFATLPYLFGVPLGFLADRSSKKTLLAVIVAGIVLLGFLPFIKILWLMLACVLLIGLCVYYSMLVLERVATNHERRSHMGSLSGAFLSVFQIAQITSPIVIGFLVDFQSLRFAIVAVCIVGLVTAAPLFLKRVKIFEAI